MRRRRASIRPSSERTGEPKFLTTRESAGRLGVTVNALKAWIRDEQLPALRTPGGHHRIAEADLMAFQAKLAASSLEAARVRPRVLVVDDDHKVLALLKEVLKTAMPDAVVELADDGYEALVRVGAFRPDVLVLDIRMPRLDGFEVCQRLKARPETRSIRVLAMTAYSEGAVRERILAAGADDFLEKPFAVEEFRSRLAPLLTKEARHKALHPPSSKRQ